jgi:ribosomal protection tetracycline resistance protein
VCVERPRADGAAVELLRRGRSPAHPFLATVGLAVAPLPPGSGVTFELDVDVKSIPIHVFDTVEAFRQLMERTVRDTLRQGIHGWEVTDCRVTMTECDYQAPPRRWPGTTLSDYRLLTPLVLMAALARAGTTVLEPVLRFHLEVPAEDVGTIMAVLGGLDARPSTPDTDGSTAVLEGEIRVARLHALQSRLPGLTRGEGLLESAFAGYRPIEGPPPLRPRTDRNPLDRADYLRRVTGSR